MIASREALVTFEDRQAAQAKAAALPRGVEMGPWFSVGPFAGKTPHGFRDAFAPEREVDKAFWDTAQLIPLDPRKVHTGLRIDADVLDWFKVRGRLADQDERGVALVL